MVISEYKVSDSDNMRVALGKINDNNQGIVFVCNQEDKLIGVVTDGDIRRFFLNGGKLEDNVKEAMHAKPITIDSRERIADDICNTIRDRKIKAIPVVNAENRIVDILFGSRIDSVRKPVNLPVVIMAGGKGTRLKPYTDVLPKPLIPIGEETIIERIMNEFRRNGCKQFHIIVNYKKELIKAYFENQSDEIRFVEEENYYGTAGGLSLLKGEFKETFILSNCDVLIDTDYSKMTEAHNSQRNLLTVVAVKRRDVIPYGVIEVSEDHEIKDIIEKPEREYLVNAGFYIVEPKLLELIPSETFIHMTDIIAKCQELGYRVGTYVIEEDSWHDMGQKDELSRMLSFYI